MKITKMGILLVICQFWMLVCLIYSYTLPEVLIPAGVFFYFFSHILTFLAGYESATDSFNNGLKG